MKKGQKNRDRHPVLVIEDDAAQLKTIADILESEDLQPICCSTGKEALNAVKQQELNVAILDLRLPDIEGLELLKKLKQHNPEIKVIINTGYASLESALEAINEEVYAYVRKMGNVEELLKHVHRAFHTHLTSYSEKLEREVKKRAKELLQANDKLKQEMKERKKTESAVEIAKNEWEITFDAMSDWVCLMDLKGKIVRTNRVGEAFTNLSLSKIVGKSCCNIVHGTEQPIPGCPLRKMLKTGKKESIEIQIPDSDRWLQVTVDPVLDKEGNMQSAVHIARDITERKRSEAALIVSEAKYRGIFDESVAAIYVFDVKKNFIDSNEAGLNLLGYSREELLNMSIPDVDADPIVVLPAHEKLIAGERLINYEHKLKRKDGTIITVLNNSRSLTAVDGNFIGMQSTLIDITERKRIEEDLRKREEQYRAIFQTAANLITSVDEEGMIVDCNNRIKQVLGYERDEIIGQNMAEIIHPDYLSRAKKSLEEILSTGFSYNKHYKMVRKDGQLIDVEINSSGLKGKNSQYYRTICIIKDITKRMRAEEALKQRTFDLGERVKEINCLFQVSQLTAEHNRPLDEILQKTVELLPPAWQYPEITCSRILFDGKSYTTSNWQETDWKQSTDLGTGEGNEGVLEVAYLEGKPEIDEGPFLKEERNLIDTLGRMLVDYLERTQAEDELKRSREWFSAVFGASRDGIVVEDNEIITYANSAFAKHYGYDSVDELIGQHVSIVQSGEDNERMLEFGRLRASGKPAPNLYEYKGKQKKGALIDFEASVSSVDITGKSYIITVIRDITERKQAERALEESEAHLRTLTQTATNAIMSIDANGEIFIWNEAATRMFGYQTSEVIGQDLHKLIVPKQYHEKALAGLKQFVKNGTGAVIGKTLELTALRKDGTEFPVELSISSYKRGDSWHATGIIRDITERKWTAMKLQQQHKILNAISHVQSQFIRDTDPRKVFDSLLTKILSLTKSEYGFIGEILYTESDQPYLKAYTLTNIAWNQETHDFYNKHASTGFEFTNLKTLFGAVITSGKPVIANQPESDPRRGGLPKAHPPLNAFLGIPFCLGEKITGMVGVANRPGGYDDDVIEFLRPVLDTCAHIIEALRSDNLRKQAEAALQDSEKRLRDLFESSPDAIFVEDLDGQVLDVNPAACNLHGVSSNEIIGKNVSELIPTEHRDEVQITFQKLIKGEIDYLDSFSLTNDGKSVPVEIRANRFEYANQPAFLLQVRDATERKRLEEQLFQSQKMEAIGRLAGGVAHDFNNLLTVILGNVEFGLQDSNPGDPVQLDLMSIDKAATEASELVRQLLTFSKSQNFEPTTVDLNNIINNHIKMLRRIIGEDIDLNTNLDKKLSKIWADSTQIQRILMNLSVNARDAMPKGGELIIETRNFVADENFYHELNRTGTQLKSKNQSGNYVELTIIDMGKGMDKQTLDRIFDPFFTTKKTGEGTGLGLAVVYGIVKQHDGLIKVNSQLGKGASFKIYLPTTSESTEQALKNERKAKFHRGEETILVVEDEDAVRNVTFRILTELGYNVRTAKDGNEALNYFKSQKGNIDLVILDVVMPEYSGPETYKRLCSMKPDLPVIYVTGYDVHSEIMESDDPEQGSVTVLQKPYTKNALGQKVRELLDN